MSDPGAQSVDSVLAEFEHRQNLLEDFCARTKQLIEACLEDAQIRFQSIQARVKSRSKLRAKYTDPGKNYRCLDNITDLAALRVITYYEDEVDSVAEVIEREFKIDPDRSVDKRKTDPDRFGYDGVNYICRHNAERSASTEYKKFSSVLCEIQITSILSHAWAEIEHDWYDLKGSFPEEVKRRFFRMKALLEIADSEFLELRKKRVEYQRSVAVQIEAKVPDIPLDIVSLKSFIDQEPLVGRLDQAVAAGRGYATTTFAEPAIEPTLLMAIRAGLTTVADLKGSLENYEKVLPDYIERSNPYLHVPTVGRYLPKGACVFFLGMMLAGSAGSSTLSEALRAAGHEAAANAEKLAMAAQEAMRKWA